MRTQKRHDPRIPPMTRMMKFFGLAVAVLGLAAGAAVPARAGIIVQYAFSGGSFGLSMIGPNASAGAVNATGSLATIEPGVADPDTLFLSQGGLSTTPAAAVANQAQNERRCHEVPSERSS